MLAVAVALLTPRVALGALEAVALAAWVLAALLQALQTPVEAVVVAMEARTPATRAAQASSSFPMLAHNSLVAVSSLLLVATPFTHLQLLALLFQLHP